MTATWTDVLHIFDRTVGSTRSYRTSISTLMDNLRLTPEGELLGVNLAIDLHCGSLTPGSIVNFDKLLASASTSGLHDMACWRDNNTTDLVLASAHACPILGAPDHYIRVLREDTFLTHYAGPIYGYTLSLADRIAFRRSFLSDPSGRPLGDIDVLMSNDTGAVMVTSSNDMQVAENILRSDPAQGLASIVNDVLGLGHDVGAELVMVSYPPGFDGQVKTRQPTILDVSWRSPNFYLSYLRLDGWGRTHSCSGDNDSRRERVHEAFRGLTDHFKLYPLGEVKVYVPKRDMLRRIAYERLEAALSSAP